MSSTDKDCAKCNPGRSGHLVYTVCEECALKETVGAAASRLMAKGDDKQPVVDTMREMTKGYIEELIKCALDGAEKYGKEKPFYICVQTRRERLLTNVIRNQFYSRMTRPLPAYDLALYWYHPGDEQLVFVWCIPDKETVDHFAGYYRQLQDGTLEWVAGAKPSQEDQQLASFCTGFKAGCLI